MSPGIVVFPLVFVLTFVAVTTQQPFLLTSPGMRRGWLVVHIAMIFVGYAALFFAFSLAGMVIAVGTLWVSHDLLGFTSPAADNVAGNVVGFGLATLFRFVTYRTFVFRPPSGPQAARSGGRTSSEASN